MATKLSVLEMIALNAVVVTPMATAAAVQVTVHLKGRTECYECRSKPPPKSFPVCTIRNTPDKPIHCVVWAKELLFQRLFGRCFLPRSPSEIRTSTVLTATCLRSTFS
jgi:hypothetical protein